MSEYAPEWSELDRGPKKQNDHEFRDGDGWLAQDERQSVEEEQQLLAEVAEDHGGSEKEAR